MLFGKIETAMLYTSKASPSPTSNIKPMAPTNSLYIPRVYIPARFWSEKWQELADQTKDKIAHQLAYLEIADVESIDIQPHKSGNKPFAMAFVHIKEWHATEAASSTVTRLKEHGSAKIVYDDPHFWMLLPWESKHSRKSNSKHSKKTDLEDRMKALETTLDQQMAMLEKMTEMMRVMGSVQGTEQEVNTNGKRPRMKSEE